MQSFVNNLNLTYNLIAGNVQANPTMNSLLIGHRTLTNGQLSIPTNGAIVPNLYQPFKLGAFANGASALSYMATLGFNVGYGVTFTLDLPEPTSVALNSNGTYTLSWATIPYNFQYIVGIPLEGTVTQSTDTGTVVNAILINNGTSAQMVVTPLNSSTFDINNPVTLTGMNANTYPNPAVCDEIAFMVWFYYQMGTVLPRRAQGTPSAYLSILSSRDTTVSPNSAAFNLIDPVTATAISSSVTQLTYTTSTNNLGFLPTNAAGNIVFTQATSAATGVYAGMQISGTTVTITLNSVSGVFNATNNISVVLDSSYNWFQYVSTSNIYYKNVVSPYEVTQASDFANNLDFWDNIATLNNGQYLLQNQYGTQGFAGNISTTAINANTLPNNLNSIIYKLISYPYNAQFLDFPFSAAALASAQAYANCNNVVPYPPLDGISSNVIPVSSSAQNRYSAIPYQSADVAINQGWAPWGVNNLGVAYLIKDVTTLITDPNTSVTDTEFRFQHVFDCIAFMAQEFTALWQVASTSPIINGGTVFNSPQFRQNLKNQIVGLLNEWQRLGIVENVNAYKNLVTVIQNPTVATGVSVNIPAQIIPGLGSCNATLDIFSIYTSFSKIA